MRRVIVMLEQQPQSKNIKPADAEAFRSAILKWLKMLGQTAFRKNVFLQLDFFTTAKDPPEIYSLPKNYIDLLRKHAKVADSSGGHPFASSVACTQKRRCSAAL
ncbi:hypothetical protein KIH39_15785 [Telmatocola sphagniphila]|uniref:Uncharacterized protein n=1 Tax=Telmatocola sphagniphila TaxID=1123043 RepID=A0A8E6B1U0_9BACT|nr:hypothetical protein [Telmatocola sphagniphila]QVL30313.1 hypothetical protein KIH39_15785 [Telmatocola sphagniphila]